MLFDLASSPQTTQNLKNMFLETNLSTFLGGKGKRIAYRNAVVDSDAVFSIDRNFLNDRILESIKGRYTVHKTIVKFSYQKSRDDIIENLELFTINAITQDDEVVSLLFAGTTMSEKDLKKQKKVFSGYQLIGQIIPDSSKSGKHLEDYSISFIYDLIRAPQRFKNLEILTNSDELGISFEPFF